jgi:class 3 adenylate cyclase
MTEHTFLFADLAGFTALTEAHGDGYAARTRGELAEVLRDLPEYRRAARRRAVLRALLPGRWRLLSRRR